MTRTLFLTTVILASLGAVPSYALSQHDVAWYLANRGALQSELATCALNPGDLQNTPDCINAKAAQQRITTASL
jgi:hypothetical protein